jgi:hypothetical protein
MPSRFRIRYSIRTQTFISNERKVSYSATLADKQPVSPMTTVTDIKKCRSFDFRIQGYGSGSGFGSLPKRFPTVKLNVFCRSFKGGNFWGFFLFMCVIQHCLICRPSDSIASEDVGIESRTVATLALTARRSNHSARSHPFCTIDLYDCPIINVS